ncbi:MAG: hypothetical protein AAFR60_06690 [Pseudomonadota bacterium]
MKTFLIAMVLMVGATVVAAFALETIKAPSDESFTVKDSVRLN